MRPAALSNPSWEGTRMNHRLRIKLYRQLALARSNRRTSLSNEINAKNWPVNLDSSARIAAAKQKYLYFSLQVCRSSTFSG